MKMMEPSNQQQGGANYKRCVIDENVDGESLLKLPNRDARAWNSTNKRVGFVLLLALLAFTSYLLSDLLRMVFLPIEAKMDHILLKLGGSKSSDSIPLSSALSGVIDSDLDLHVFTMLISPSKYFQFRVSQASCDIDYSYSTQKGASDSVYLTHIDSSPISLADEASASDIQEISFAFSRTDFSATRLAIWNHLHRKAQYEGEEDEVKSHVDPIASSSLIANCNSLVHISIFKRPVLSREISISKAFDIQNFDIFKASDDNSNIRISSITSTSEAEHDSDAESEDATEKQPGIYHYKDESSIITPSKVGMYEISVPLQYEAVLSKQYRSKIRNMMGYVVVESSAKALKVNSIDILNSSSVATWNVNLSPLSIDTRDLKLNAAIELSCSSNHNSRISCPLHDPLGVMFGDLFNHQQSQMTVNFETKGFVESLFGEHIVSSKVVHVASSEHAQAVLNTVPQTSSLANSQMPWPSSRCILSTTDGFYDTAVCGHLDSKLGFLHAVFVLTGYQDELLANLGAHVDWNSQQVRSFMTGAFKIGSTLQLNSNFTASTITNTATMHTSLYYPKNDYEVLDVQFNSKWTQSTNSVTNMNMFNIISNADISVHNGDTDFTFDNQIKVNNCPSGGRFDFSAGVGGIIGQGADTALYPLAKQTQYFDFKMDMPWMMKENNHFSLYMNDVRLAVMQEKLTDFNATIDVVTPIQNAADTVEQYGHFDFQLSNNPLGGPIPNFRTVQKLRFWNKRATRSFRATLDSAAYTAPTLGPISAPKSTSLVVPSPMHMNEVYNVSMKLAYGTPVNVADHYSLQIMEMVSGFVSSFAGQASGRDSRNWFLTLDSGIISTPSQVLAQPTGKISLVSTTPSPPSNGIITSDSLPQGTFTFNLKDEIVPNPIPVFQVGSVFHWNLDSMGVMHSLYNLNVDADNGVKMRQSFGFSYGLNSYNIFATITNQEKSRFPTMLPTSPPTMYPTANPTRKPTTKPTVKTTPSPSPKPSALQIGSPTPFPVSTSSNPSVLSSTMSVKGSGTYQITTQSLWTVTSTIKTDEWTTLSDDTRSPNATLSIINSAIGLTCGSPSLSCNFGLVVEDTSQESPSIPEQLVFLAGLGFSYDLSQPSMKRSSIRLEGQVGGQAMNVTVGHSWGNGAYLTIFDYNEGGRPPTPVVVSDPLVEPTLRFPVPLSIRGSISGLYAVPLVGNQFHISIDKSRYYINSDMVASIHGLFAYNVPLPSTTSASPTSPTPVTPPGFITLNFQDVNANGDNVFMFKLGSNWHVDTGLPTSNIYMYFNEQTGQSYTNASIAFEWTSSTFALRMPIYAGHLPSSIGHYPARRLSNVGVANDIFTSLMHNQGDTLVRSPDYYDAKGKRLAKRFRNGLSTIYENENIAIKPVLKLASSYLAPSTDSVAHASVLATSPTAPPSSSKNVLLPPLLPPVITPNSALSHQSSDLQFMATISGTYSLADPPNKWSIDLNRVAFLGEAGTPLCFMTLHLSLNKEDLSPTGLLSLNTMITSGSTGLEIFQLNQMFKFDHTHASLMNRWSTQDLNSTLNVNFDYNYYTDHKWALSIQETWGPTSASNKHRQGPTTVSIAANGDLLIGDRANFVFNLNKGYLSVNGSVIGGAFVSGTISLVTDGPDDGEFFIIAKEQKFTAPHTYGMVANELLSWHMVQSDSKNQVSVTLFSSLHNVTNAVYTLVTEGGVDIKNYAFFASLKEFGGPKHIQYPLFLMMASYDVASGFIGYIQGLLKWEQKDVFKIGSELDISSAGFLRTASPTPALPYKFTLTFPASITIFEEFSLVPVNGHLPLSYQNALVNTILSQMYLPSSMPPATMSVSGMTSNPSPVAPGFRNSTELSRIISFNVSIIVYSGFSPSLAKGVFEAATSSLLTSVACEDSMPNVPSREWHSCPFTRTMHLQGAKQSCMNLLTGWAERPQFGTYSVKSVVSAMPTMMPSALSPTNPINTVLSTYAFQVKQTLTGITVAQFDASAQNVFIKAIEFIVPAINMYEGTVTIISFTVVTSSTSPSRSRSVLRQLDASNTPSIQVDYSITYKAPSQDSSAVYAMLSSAITTGTSTSGNSSSPLQAALQTIARQNNVAAMTSVKTSAATIGPLSQVSPSTASQSGSPISIAMIAGAATGGVLFLAICIGCGVFLYRRNKNANKIAYVDEFSSGFAMNPVSNASDSPYSQRQQRKQTMNLNNENLYPQAGSSRYTFEIQANHNTGFVHESRNVEGQVSVKKHDFYNNAEEGGFRITRISNDMY